MIIKFNLKEDTSDSQEKVIEELKNKLKGKVDFEVEFKLKNNNLIQTINPLVFYFQEANKSNLINIRANVGKEIDRRLKAENFEDFKISFSKATPPSDEQRGYYWAVVLPTIQKFFENEGNYIKLDDLHESIRYLLNEKSDIKTEKTNKITGEVYFDYISLSSSGNKYDVSKYIDAVIHWAIEWGIQIPEPIKH